MATVHGHGVVVPLAVAPLARNVGDKTVGAISQRVGLKSDVELVHSAVVLSQASAVGEQRAASVSIGLKPEHQRVVLLGGAVYGVLIQEHALVGLVHVQRQALWDGPRSINQLGVGTLGMVNDIVT